MNVAYSEVKLTPIELKSFEEDGYLIVSNRKILDFKNNIREGLLGVAKCIAGNYPEGKRVLESGDFESLSQLVDLLWEVEEDSRVTRAVFELFNSSCELFGTMTHPVLMSISRQLGIKVPMVWRIPEFRLDRPNETRFLSPAHQDMRASFLSPNGLVFWISLGSLDNDAGGIYGIPGSHNSGLLPVVRNIDGYWPHLLANEPSLQDMEHLILSDDSLVVFGPYFVHQSVLNKSSKSVRLTLQLRLNDVDTLPEMATAFIGKHTDYLVQQMEKNYID